jgi:hypothetical protein
VLDGCDFKRFRPWLLAIESTEPCTCTPSLEEWEHLVLDAGYEIALFHQINRYVNGGVKPGQFAAGTKSARRRCHRLGCMGAPPRN